MEYQCIDIGLTDYRQGLALQKEYLGLVKSGEIEGALIFTEHRPVFTLGRSADKNNFLINEKSIKAQGIEIHEADRGGDITFHGPGQLVAYPIIDLNNHYRDIHRYLRGLEEATISTLSDFQIDSFREDKRTGCWTAHGKIASIGIAASRWITYHGVAINANVDLKYFDMIHPCGFKDIKVTSIEEILSKPADLALLKQSFLNHFSKAFQCTAELLSAAEHAHVSARFS